MMKILAPTVLIATFSPIKNAAQTAFNSCQTIADKISQRSSQFKKAWLNLIDLGEIFISKEENEARRIENGKTRQRAMNQAEVNSAAGTLRANQNKLIRTCELNQLSELQKYTSLERHLTSPIEAH